MAKDKYFIYPQDVSAFGFDWGKLIADGGARG